MKKNKQREESEKIPAKEMAEKFLNVTYQLSILIQVVKSYLLHSDLDILKQRTLFHHWST
jgi:hypothetical protein